MVRLRFLLRSFFSLALFGSPFCHKSWLSLAAAGPALGGRSITPPPLLAEDWAQLSLGRYGGCGLTSRHRLLCWGIRGLCREGHGGHCPREAADLPRLPPSASRWWDLGVGSWHGCAIADDRSLRCFGANEHGQSEPPRA